MTTREVATEPSLGLSPMMIDFIFDAIRHIREMLKTGILLVEQRAAEALDACDRAYIMESGKIALSGNREALAGNPIVQQTYLGEV
jgi:branched-chain amino acid transport system ATP-binding protein